MNDQEDQNSPSPDIPDEVIGPERALLQMFRIYFEPEVKRRQRRGFLPDPFTVVKAQVLFFENGPPEIRLNDEVKISLVARTPRAIEEGEQISLSELQQMQIETSELDLADADAGHFTCGCGQRPMVHVFRLPSEQVDS